MTTLLALALAGPAAAGPSYSYSLPYDWWDHSYPARSPCPPGSTLLGGSAPEHDGYVCLDADYRAQGRVTLWDVQPDGQVGRIDGIVYDGIPAGGWTTLDASGQLTRVITYDGSAGRRRERARLEVHDVPFALRGGRRATRSMVDFEDGRPTHYTDYQGRRGRRATVTLVNPNAHPMASWSTRDGERHGVSTAWHMDGSISEQGRYEDGLAEGLWRRWHADGQILSMGTYRDGHPHGDWTCWDERGAVAVDGRYRDGYRVGRWRFDAGAAWQRYPAPGPDNPQVQHRAIYESPRGGAIRDDPCEDR